MNKFDSISQELIKNQMESVLTKLEKSGRTSEYKEYKTLIDTLSQLIHMEMYQFEDLRRSKSALRKDGSLNKKILDDELKARYKSILDRIYNEGEKNSNRLSTALSNGKYKEHRDLVMSYGKLSRLYEILNNMFEHIY